jgi:uncharacterized protein YecE (DUF72 family)
MLERLHVGTSGFAYPTWKPAFYPADLPQSRFLEFYAERFDTVELNNTFYRFPAEKQLADWAQRTPEGFRFGLKANQRITHYARLKNAGETARDFVERCQALGTKLGPILFGLHPQTARDDDRLTRFLAELPESGRYAFEFRHPSWLDPAVLELLRAAKAALCVAESEEMTAPREATADFVYVRLRKAAYADSELEDWRKWLAGQVAAGREAFVYVKHDDAGMGAEIARRLAGRTPP